MHRVARIGQHLYLDVSGVDVLLHNEDPNSKHCNPSDEIPAHRSVLVPFHQPRVDVFRSANHVLHPRFGDLGGLGRIEVCGLRR